MISTSVGRPAASSLATTSSSAAHSRGIVCSSSKQGMTIET